VELKSAKIQSARTIKPKLSHSHALITRKKAIRVLLDSGLSGDLLFAKKGAYKHMQVVKRITPRLWGTSNGTFVTKRVGDIEIAFVDYSESKRI
jgi:hypothetical protein